MSNNKTITQKKPLTRAVSLSVLIIRGYQIFLNPVLKSLLGVAHLCDQSPSCSTYAILALHAHGFWKGWFKALHRVASCQPFAKKSLWKY